MEEQMEKERDNVRKREKDATEAERIARMEIAKARGVSKKALDMKKEKSKLEDVLMETTGKAFFKTLFDVVQEKRQQDQRESLVPGVEGNGRNESKNEAHAVRR